MFQAVRRVAHEALPLLPRVDSILLEKHSCWSCCLYSTLLVQREREREKVWLTGDIFQKFYCPMIRFELRAKDRRLIRQNPLTEIVLLFYYHLFVTKMIVGQTPVLKLRTLLPGQTKPKTRQEFTCISHQRKLLLLLLHFIAEYIYRQWCGTVNRSI